MKYLDLTRGRDNYGLFFYLFLFCLLCCNQTAFGSDNNLLIVPPPDITITCDYDFPFNPNDPNAHIGEFDARFGKIVQGPSFRNKIYVEDRVCPSHPRFSEYAPSNPFSDPCYDDVYSILWGNDGYVDGTSSVPGFQNIVPNLNCNRGYLIREWREWPHDPVVATQRITIINCQEFYVPTACWRSTPGDLGTCDFVNGSFNVKIVEWPCDVEISRCQTSGADAFDPNNLPVSFAQDRRPRLASNSCNLLAATYEDVSFSFIDNACRKIFRTWTVIDWCLYEDYVNGTYFGEYEWTFTQVIKLLNSDTPDFSNCEDREFCGLGNPDNPQGDQCTGKIELRPDYEDDCTDKVDIKIDYKIDLFDDGTTDLRGYSSNFDVNPFGTLPAREFPDTLANADGVYPVGTHKILWTAEDGCGNTSSCQFKFTIQDCKPPTPYCRDGVSTIPMPQQAGGFVDIWASDYNIGSFDNCTEQDDLLYSFSDDPTDNVRRFTCIDAPGLYTLTVYAWDLGLDGLPRNFATCDVTIQLTDCSGQTTNNVAISVSTENGFAIADAWAYVRYANGALDSALIGPQGQIDIEFDTTQAFTLEVRKDGDDRNGISTFDLVSIAKDVVSIESLNSPYKKLAGDVNMSNSLTTFDIIEIRKLILYIITEFSHTESWQFVPADHVFSDPDNPFGSSFPNSVTINSLNTGMDINFIGFKMGDVNNSARLTDEQPAEARGASNFLVVKDREVEAGETFEVSFSAGEDMSINGYQLSLGFDPAKIQPLDISATDNAYLTRDNFGWSLVKEGLLTMSWHDRDAFNKNAGETLFTLKMVAKEKGLLSELIQLSDKLQAEYYEEDLTIRGLELRFKQTYGNEFALFQNQPNPFTNNTEISFTLPKAGSATLRIFDVAGKVLKVIIGDYDKGYNSVTIKKSELNGAGVLYYTLETQNESATQKMIVLE